MNNQTEPILITGGSGFAGSHLIEHLIELGYSNVHATTFSDKPSILNEMLDEEKIHILDLTNDELVEKLLESIKPVQIYHLAAIAIVGDSFARGKEVLTNNILLQHTLLEAVRKVSSKSRLLIVGSAEEYGISQQIELPLTEQQPFRPVNPYAVSKIAQDMLAYAYAVSYQLDIVRVRPFNHIGERQTEEFAVPAFAKQIVAIERGQQHELVVGNLAAVRDFTDVKDMVTAYRIVMEKGQSNQVYNLGSGRGIKMQRIIELMTSLSQTEIKIKIDPQRFRPLDIKEIIADNTAITKLGWQPKIGIEATLQRIIDYWRKIS